MVKLVTGLLLAVLSCSVALTYALPLLGPPNWQVVMLASAATLVSVPVLLSARTAVTTRTFVLATTVAALALVVFGFGMSTSLVVHGRVLSYTSEPAGVARQLADLTDGTATLEAAKAALSASPAEQFARNGSSAKLSDTCAELLRTWDRTVPATVALVPAIVAMKEGASACSQGTKVSAESSSTPDEQTTAAVTASRDKIATSLATVRSVVVSVTEHEHLGGTQ